MTGQELKNIRKANGLTQPVLAEILNAGLNTVKYWEMGKRKISPSIQLLIELIFKIKPLPDLDKYRKGN